MKKNRRKKKKKKSSPQEKTPNQITPSKQRENIRPPGGSEKQKAETVPPDGVCEKSNLGN